ncbi:MAG: class I SAM-dependent methyltransferase, partial [Candidatus Omnitrophica bacterium]|nr:class I SAM-dependent methyltransferase [Candidatus Omnitrophota bacterium]
YIAANSDYKELLEEAGFQILRVEDNSRQFTNIIAKWEGVNLSYKNMLIKECGLDYFNTAIKRWRLAREFSQAGVLGQNLFICRKAFSSSMMEKEQTKKILNLLSGFCGLWVINAGLESGLLGIIADYRSALSEKKMIAKSGLAPRYVKNWLYAAYSFEIIDYIPGKGFIYAPFAKEAIERLKNEICMYAKLSRVFASLPRAMSGKPRKPLLKQDFALVKAMSEVTKSDFPEITGQIIPKIPRLEMKLKKGAAMLDVGAGLGHGAIHFAKVFPKSIISGVEIDERAYKTALKNIKKEGLENRVSIKKVDANKMHFNKKFDFVFLNLTFHEISQDYERKILFLKKCRTMLKEGGVFLISELPFPAKIAECRAPAMKILSSLSICEAFFGGELASPSGYKEFLKKAGYKNIRQLKQGNPVRVFISATG